MPFVLPDDPVSGQIAPVTWGDAVRDALNYLANPPACRVYHNTTQAYADATEATQAFNSERWDTDGMHSTSVDTGRITIRTAGLYIVGFTGSFDAGNDYVNTFAFLRVNGTTYVQLGAEGRSIVGISAQQVSVHTVYRFAVNDYIEVRALQNNSAGASRNMTSGGNFSPEFYATWIGLG